MTPPIVSFIGKSDSGKTSLLEKVIPELKRRGYRVATVKHHSHPGFDIDIPGKDTWRHAQAGSDHVVISAPDRIASIRRLEHELSLDEIAATVTDADIILTEGFKNAGKPSIEVMRRESGLVFVTGPGQRIAVASDTPIECDVPLFSLDDAVAIIDFIEATFLKS